MMNRIKKKINIGLLLSFMFCLCACGNSKCITENITIEAGNNYSLEFLEKGEVIKKCNSSNPSVADVFFDSFIQGYSVGTAVIVIDTEHNRYEYKISVEDEEDKSYVVLPELRDKSLYMGAGYNALTASAVPDSYDILVDNPIIPSETISNYFDSHKKSLTAKKDYQEKSATLISSKSSEIKSDYRTKISGELGLSFPIGANADVSGEIDRLGSDSAGNKDSYYLMTKYCKVRTYLMNVIETDVLAMVKSNGEFWNDLTGDMDPMELFDTWGTHMVVSVDMGGRADVSYHMYSTDSTTNSESVSALSLSVSEKIVGIKVSASAGFLQEEMTAMKKMNIRMQTSIKLYGGNRDLLYLNIEQFVQNYSKWHDGLASESNWAVIGIPENGLVAIWKFLDDYPERAYEIEAAYNAASAELLNTK